MHKTIAVIYENGVFRPLEDVGLEEGKRLKALLVEDDQKNVSQAGQELLEMLAHPFRMGRLKYKRRRELYDDLD